MVKIITITIILTTKRCCHCMASSYLLDINKAIKPEKDTLDLKTCK
jgi:hypothetical protein